MTVNIIGDLNEKDILEMLKLKPIIHEKHSHKHDKYAFLQVLCNWLSVMAPRSLLYCKVWKHLINIRNASRYSADASL